MSTQFAFSSRNNTLCSSTTFFPNSSPKSSHSPLTASSSNFFVSKKYAQNSSSDQPCLPSKPIISQSSIFAPLNQNYSRPSGFTNLQNMARHLPTQQNQEFNTMNSQNSLQPSVNQQFKAKRDFNPFASQVNTAKTFNGFDKKIDSKRLSAEPTDTTRRRRQSIELEAVSKQGAALANNLRFLQRGSTVLLQKQKIEKIADCESTGSGSGNDLIKPKCYDFLKKRKGSDQQQEISQNPKLDSSQSLKQLQQFAHFRRPQQIWPLSISPMDQRTIQTKLKDQFMEPASANKLEYRQKAPEHSTSPFSAIEFKKRKLTDSQASKKSHEGTKDVRINKEEPLARSRFMRPQRDITIDDFQILDKLGKGAFGEVFMAREKQLGFFCVIKKMSKKRIRQAKVEQHIIRQIKLQSYLSHNHLTSLYGYFHDEDDLYLILQLLPDGSLQQVKKKRKLPEKDTIDIVRQVAIGLKYMHQEFIIHRDLKPQNIFVNEGYIKIGDFGCSIYHNEVGLRNTIVGCLEYSSPEQLCKEGYSDKIDAWSLGILTYELLFGKSPFQSDIKKIVRNNESKPELSEVSFPTAPVLSDQGKSFILKLLDMNPEFRMDMDEVLAHPFLRQEDKK